MGGTDDFPGVCDGGGIRMLRDAEICHLHQIVLCDDDVMRLDVPMDDIAVVG